MHQNVKNNEVGEFGEGNFRTSQRPDIVDRLPLRKIAPVVWQLPLSSCTNVRKEIRNH